MSTEIDVLVLGGAGVDTIVHVPELPVPFADSHMIRPGIVTRAGQSGDFVALGTTALGLRTHHLDLLGDDPEGDLVRALHREHGIGLTAVPQPLGTKRAVNLVGPDGRRSSLYDATRADDTDRFYPRTHWFNIELDLYTPIQQRLRKIWREDRAASKPEG